MAPPQFPEILFLKFDPEAVTVPASLKMAPPLLPSLLPDSVQFEKTTNPLENIAPPGSRESL